MLLGSCVPTLFMLLVFVFLSWQEKCACLNSTEDDDDPHIRPPPRCATHASAVITNTRWLRLIIFITSASFICATSLISIVCPHLHFISVWLIMDTSHSFFWWIRNFQFISLFVKVKQVNLLVVFYLLWLPYRLISTHQIRFWWKLIHPLMTSACPSTDPTFSLKSSPIILPDLIRWESARIMITQMSFMYQWVNIFIFFLKKKPRS